MKIKTRVKIMPFILSGLLSASFSCAPKKDNKITEEIKNESVKIEYEVIEDEVKLSYEEDKKIEPTNENNIIELSYYVMALENIKIYSDTNIKSDKLGMLIKGQSLLLLSEVNDDWYEIQYNGESGYIKKDQVEIYEYYEPINDEIIPSIKNNDDLFNYFDYMPIVTATTKVNVREYATTDSLKLDQLKKGDSLPLISEGDEWCEVNYYGKSAYVYKEYVKISNNYFSKYSMIDMVYMTRSNPLYDIETNEVIANIPKMEVAEVYAKKDDYYIVKYNNNFGLIYKKYACSLGDRYVIIDISNQNLKVYVDDNLVVDTAVVTGKDSSPTYCGLFSVRTKEENVYWPEFKVKVRYWLPFNRGEGMHDAKWRKRFGGDIFHKDGSHGCVNIPVDIMPLVYQSVEEGTPVLVKK